MTEDYNGGKGGTPKDYIRLQGGWSSNFNNSVDKESNETQAFGSENPFFGAKVQNVRGKIHPRICYKIIDSNYLKLDEKVHVSCINMR